MQVNLNIVLENIHLMQNHAVNEEQRNKKAWNVERSKMVSANIKPN